MPALPSWIAVVDQGVLVRFYIQPGASRSEISGQFGDGTNSRVKIRVAAPPVEGAANKELLRFLKKVTGVPTSRLHLIRGETSRSKDIVFIGSTLGEIQPLFKFD